MHALINCSINGLNQNAAYDKINRIRNTLQLRYRICCGYRLLMRSRHHFKEELSCHASIYVWDIINTGMLLDSRNFDCIANEEGVNSII